MTRFEEGPVPPVFPVAPVRRVRAVRIPRRVLRPARRQLRPAWEARQRVLAREAERGAAPVLPPPEVDPPETYGEHGERLHGPEAAAPRPHLDLEG